MSIFKDIARPDNDSLFTRPQAANYLGVKPETLAIWAVNKKYSLPYIKVGRLVKYRKTDLDAFLSERTVGRAA